jgi:hypothetical protein
MQTQINTPIDEFVGRAFKHMEDAAIERAGLTSGRRFNKSAQATAATIRLMSGLTRGVFIDVMSSWTDLLAANDREPSPMSSGPVFWGDMVDRIKAALLSGSSPDAVHLWADADEAVRGYALVAADAREADAKKVQGDDHWDDIEPSRQAEIIHSHGQAARLRAFAKAAA